MLVLKKIADDDRDWRHFERFNVAYLERERMGLTAKQLVLRFARRSGTEKILRGLHSRFRSNLGRRAGPPSFGSE